MVASTANSVEKIPKPQLVLDSRVGEAFVGPGGVTHMKFQLSVRNSDQYSDALFAPAPHLPPCGLNTSSSRSWVQIFDNAVPSMVYVEIWDRETGERYASNAIPIPGALVDAALPDLVVTSVVPASDILVRNTFYPLTYIVSNVGNAVGGTSTFDVLAYLSSDAVLDDSDLPLTSAYSVWTYPLSVGWSASDTRRFLTIPGSVSPGEYYIIVLADALPERPPNFYPGVVESNETNNWRASMQILVQ
jgi:hypothetical protein